MPITGNEAEWQTRKMWIDTRLRSLNPSWKIILWHTGLNPSKLTCQAVTEFPTEKGPADFALFAVGILLGIIEAKKGTLNPQIVLEHARRYSRGAAIHCFQFNPSVKSSLTFLCKTPWACEKIEAWFMPRKGHC